MSNLIGKIIENKYLAQEFPSFSALITVSTTIMPGFFIKDLILAAIFLVSSCETNHK